MVYATVEHAIRVVSAHNSFEINWKIRSLSQSVDIDRVGVVAAVGSAFRLIRLVDVCLCCEIPCIGGGVDDTSGLEDHSAR